MPLHKNDILLKLQCPTTDKEKGDMKRLSYLIAVGLLMYVAMGLRPDIMYSVAHLSQFCSNPGYEHWMGAQRIVWYLHGSKAKCLVLGGLNDLWLFGYMDSDWGSDIDH